MKKTLLSAVILVIIVSGLSFQNKAYSTVLSENQAQNIIKSTQINPTIRYCLDFYKEYTKEQVNEMTKDWYDKGYAVHTAGTGLTYTDETFDQKTADETENEFDNKSFVNPKSTPGHTTLGEIKSALRNSGLL
ncbi:hypothetical protein [Lactococcus taiwanensis]|uniref:hypothetical protein n=1 Tax=Lactococcus taiwanensis TaxID=1151742 RepID=UPI0023F4BDAD|nr:hypothetical protein [Lactococcus taiwanensis]